MIFELYAKGCPLRLALTMCPTPPLFTDGLCRKRPRACKCKIGMLESTCVPAGNCVAESVYSVLQSRYMNNIVVTRKEAPSRTSSSCSHASIYLDIERPSCNRTGVVRSCSTVRGSLCSGFGLKFAIHDSCSRFSFDTNPKP